MRASVGPVLRHSLLLGVVLAWLGAAAPVAADTLFWEDFDGYTSFPSQNPSGDYVNAGLPLTSEGADETWRGVRFGGLGATAASIDADIFVQKCGDYTGSNCQTGSPNNNTPVGRFEDDAGIILEISTLGYQDVTIDFDWRTFSAGTSDRFRAGYITSSTPISFTSYNGGGYADLRTGSFAWANWTELMNGTAGVFQSAPTYALPGNADYLYVTFWLDNGEGDHGKVDNVHIQGTLVPEPGTALLVGVGLTLLAAHRRRA